MRSSVRLFSRLTSTSTARPITNSVSILSPRARVMAVGTGVGMAVIGTAAYMSTQTVNAAPSTPSTSILTTSLPTLSAAQAATHSFSAPPAVNETHVRVGLCQVTTRDDKQANLKHAADAVSRAVAGGAKIVVLPEMFNCPYANSSFPTYAEEIGFTTQSVAKGQVWTPNPQTHPSSAAISSWAKQHGVWIVAGSIPEREAKTGRLYNTAIVVNPQGQFVAKHRKVHLFDIDVPGRMTFRESDTLSPGNDLTLFDTPYGRIGLGICYDLRFPEYAQLATQNGANILIYPGAFNTTTGPLHWELLIRARAVDNQVYVAACSPARDPTASYQAWGHSSVISPWGDVVATTGHESTIVFADMDLTRITQMRQNIPTRQQKRHDLYRVIHVQDPNPQKQ